MNRYLIAHGADFSGTVNVRNNYLTFGTDWQDNIQHTAQGFHFYNNGTEHLTVKSDGNLQINTAGAGLQFSDNTQIKSAGDLLKKGDANVYFNETLQIIGDNPLVRIGSLVMQDFTRVIYTSSYPTYGSLSQPEAFVFGNIYFDEVSQKYKSIYAGEGGINLKPNNHGYDVIPYTTNNGGTAIRFNSDNGSIEVIAIPSVSGSNTGFELTKNELLQKRKLIINDVKTEINNDTRINGALTVAGKLMLADENNPQAQPIDIAIKNNYLTFDNPVNITEELKIGNNSLYLGSTASNVAGNYIYADNGPLKIQNGTSGHNTILNERSGVVGIGLSATLSTVSIPRLKLDVNGIALIRDQLLLNDNLEQMGSLRFDDQGFTIGLPVEGIDMLNVRNSTGGTYLQSTGDMYLNNNGGAVIIGASKPNTSKNPDCIFSVDGRLYAKRITVPSSWADHVFDKKYNLMDMAKLSEYIELNKKLPEMPSAAEIEKNGIDAAEMFRLQMQKIEELTLYVLKQQKELEQMKIQLKTYTK